MNNSSITFEEPLEEVKEVKEERLGKLKALVEAAGKLKASDEWRTLKEEVQGETEYLERLMKLESNRKEIQPPELYRLQGRLFESKHHSLDALEEKWRNELLNLKKQ